MSDYRYNQGAFGGDWREGSDRSASEQELEQRYSQQGQQGGGGNNPAPVNPDDAFLYGAMQDPVLKQQLANDLRNRVMGQYGNPQMNQQQQLDPIQQLEKEISDLDQQLAAENAKPHAEKDWGEIYRLDSLKRDKRVDLVDKRNEMRYNQTTATTNATIVRDYFTAFMNNTVGKMPIPDEQKNRLTEEFIAQLRSEWNVAVLGDPQEIQKVVPHSWKSFAYDRGLPRPDQYGRYQQGNQQPTRQGEQYNGMTPPPPPPADPNDPLANLAQMSDHERALLKAFHYEAGRYELAAKITNRDGSPIRDRRQM